MRIALIIALLTASAQGGIPILGDENIIVVGDTLTKVTPTIWRGENAWHSDFQSAYPLPRDFYIEFRLVGNDDINTDPTGDTQRREGVMLGIATNPLPEPTWLNVDFGLLTGPRDYVWFTPDSVGPLKPMVKGDLFAIEKRGGRLFFFHNKEMVYSAAVPSNRRYYVDGNIPYQGNEVQITIR